MVTRNNPFTILLSLISNVFIFLLSFVLIFLAVISLLILSPLCFTRFIIYKCSKLFNPQLGKIITARSTLSAVDDLYTKPKCTIFSVMIGPGDMDLELTRQQMLHQGVEKKLPNGQLKYPELKQYISPWMGFLFWKQDNNFDIKNHIKYYNPNGDPETFSEDTITEEEYQKIVVQLIKKPFPRERSPWELLIFRNYKPKACSNSNTKYSLYMLRLNHALMDGYSILKFTSDVSGDTKLISDIAQASALKKGNKAVMCFGMLWAYLKLPFELTKFFLSPQDKGHGWRKKESEITGKLHFGIGKRLDMQYFKDLKTANKVSVSSILLAGIAGGIRRMMLEQGLKPPKFIKVAYPFPMPNHPYKLRNHVSLGVLTLPISEDNRSKRLKNIDVQFKQISFSSLPLAMFYASKVVGSLPTCLVKSLAKAKLTTGLVSNFPGPSRVITIADIPAPEGFFGGGLLRGDTGIVINTPSMVGKVMLTIMADSGIIHNEKQMAQLIEFIENEFLSFSNSDV